MVGGVAALSTLPKLDRTLSWELRQLLPCPAFASTTALPPCNATLKFLETDTTVPAPRAFSLRRRRQRFGVPLQDILAELAKHPFPKAGSLLCFQSSSSIEVSAVASDRFIVLDPEGPFDNSIAYYTAFAEQYLTLIADGQLYTEYYPVDAYLVYRFLKGLAAARLGRRQDTEAQTTPGEFFLKHVDENLHITGVIDWQMARVVPPQEAFGPSLATADMSALVDDVALADALEERGSDLLSWLVVWSPMKEREDSFGGLALEPKWSYALPLAKCNTQSLRC
ncbi:hypothetical protein QBC46DRAFT_458073 [Diplogelasinospora grovesii]|uniref:Aminoglycoside phosphotransferase domain-containing protein n=1 Tax=Diplogelasinospora grovesii TaxID=303347 RepID=A0AAN6NAB5_9PEZI|nr:hypothetical protein QBC46DRAFT_458073 [Diplogelasinospora grovesii]